MSLSQATEKSPECQGDELAHRRQMSDPVGWERQVHAGERHGGNPYLDYV